MESRVRFVAARARTAIIGRCFPRGRPRSSRGNTGDRSRPVLGVSADAGNDRCRPIVAGGSRSRVMALPSLCSRSCGCPVNRSRGRRMACAALPAMRRLDLCSRDRAVDQQRPRSCAGEKSVLMKRRCAEVCACAGAESANMPPIAPSFAKNSRRAGILMRTSTLGHTTAGSLRAGRAAIEPGFSR